MRIPFLPKRKKSENSASNEQAKAKRQKQKALSSLEQSKQRQKDYKKRFTEY